MSPLVESLPELESVACYVCGARESQPWAEENGYSAVRCRGCGLVYVNPRPTRDSISLAAQSGLHAGSATLDETGARDARKVKHYQQRLRALFDAGALAQKPGARWLDIGCGFGEFLEALKLESAGRLSSFGSEPNERKAAVARNRGLDVTFRDVSTEARGYAFVSLLNVFSHLPEPPELLRQLAGLLEPGGQLVLQTGNWAELERQQISDRLHLPDHLSFASEELVKRVLEASGFTDISVLRYPMFRPSLLARLRGLGQTAPTAVACDLWFRARLRS
jgi:SAM-dependent methyltransferase